MTYDDLPSQGAAVPRRGVHDRGRRDLPAYPAAILNRGRPVPCRVLRIDPAGFAVVRVTRDSGRYRRGERAALAMSDLRL